MHKRSHAAALALTIWYLALPTVAGRTESDSENKWLRMMPPEIETQNGFKVELGAAINDWPVAGKYPSRELCERAREICQRACVNSSCDSATRLQVSNARCVYRDDLVVVWCLSITEGKVGCANCVHDLVMMHDGCVEKFKTESECILGGYKYVQDYYAKAEKDGNLVVEPPQVKCGEEKPPGL